jgi:hypothetical protein
MSRTKAKPKLLPFDAARYLTDDAAVAEYVTAVLETGDSDLTDLETCAAGTHRPRRWADDDCAVAPMERDRSRAG